MTTAEKQIETITTRLYLYWKRTDPNILQRILSIKDAKASEQALKNDKEYIFNVEDTAIHISTIKEKVTIHKIETTNETNHINNTLNLEELTKAEFRNKLYKIWKNSVN